MDTQVIDNKTEKLTTVEWVSKKLDIPVPSIYDYARRGLLPCIRIGKHVRFRPCDIERFITEGGKQ